MTKAFALAGVLALVAAPALAHHSFAIFDAAKMSYTTGSIKEFEFVNPHAWLNVTILDGKGQSTVWSFEGGSVAQLASLGWSKDTFRVGDKVEVGFHPMKDGSRGGQLMSVKTASGKKLCSNRGCGDGTGNILAPF